MELTLRTTAELWIFYFVLALILKIDVSAYDRLTLAQKGAKTKHEVELTATIS